MADRSIVLRLRAEISDYVSKMKQAKAATEELGDSTESTSKKSRKGLRGLAESARENRSEWTTAGTALATFGGAVTAVGVAALKTGIEYNTLQQTSRAALKTLTGSAEQANIQMDKLDAFARTSPFAKQVFITAQQQMLGFGIEARKVIPYLDSIQQAVAATGGSNQDIAELAEIFSKVQANAKITAIDLMQFGKRGVDAATLIGSQMGKTGAQIREEITAGTLDAHAALDALAAGMQATYGGAADNVKNTIAGAFDRVKAAWRDLSADLAAPLVGQEGGGLLVGLLNSLADFMRLVESMPGPVKNMFGVLGGGVGVTASLAGAFLLLAPRVADTWVAFNKLAPGGLTARDALSKVGSATHTAARGFAVAGTALIAFNLAGMAMEAWTSKGAKGVNELDAALKNVAKSGDSAALFADTLNTTLQNSLIGGNWEAGSGPADWLAEFSNRNWLGNAQKSVREFLGLWNSTEAGQFEKRLKEIDASLTVTAEATLPEAVDQFNALHQVFGGTDEAARNMLTSMPGLRDVLIGIASEAGLATDDLTLLKIITGEVAVESEGAEGAVDEFGNALDGASGAAKEHVDALWELTAQYSELARGVLDAREAERRWYEAIDRANASIEENGKTLDISTEAGRKNESALDDIANAGWALIEQQREQGASNSELRASMAQTREEFINTAIEMGATQRQAEQYADELGLIPANVSTDVQLTGVDEAARKLRGFSDQVYNLRGTSIRIPVTTSLPNNGLGLGYYGGGRALGGPIHGPGTEKSDSILIRASRNEHVISAAEVRGAGGHGAIAALRAEWRAGKSAGGYQFANGGTPAGRFPATAPSIRMSMPAGLATSQDLDRRFEAFADRIAYQMGLSSTGAGAAAAGSARAYADSAIDSQAVIRR